MNRIYAVAVTVAVITLCVTCAGQSTTPNHPSLKRSEVKRLLKRAQAPDDYEQLSVYFDQRAKQFLQKAQEEDTELERLREATYRAKNYAIMVDRARNYGDYDRAEAKRCTQKAEVLHLQASAEADKQLPPKMQN